MIPPVSTPQTRAAAIDGYIAFLETCQEGGYKAGYDAAIRAGATEEAADAEGRKEAAAAGVEGERWLGQNDLFYLLVFILNRGDVNRDWLFDRCREVQAEPDEVLHLWARFHFKSSIITFGLTVMEVLNDPEITIAIFSDTNKTAQKFLEQIKREFETNDRLKLLYPEVLYARPDKESPLWSIEKGIVVRRTGNPKEATIEAHGLVDGMPTGMHYRLRVYDDLVTVNTITSDEMMAKVTMRMEMSEALTVEGGGRRRFIGTTYHPLDSYAALKKKGGVKIITHPATHNGKDDGKPVFLSHRELAKHRIDMGPHVFASQMLMNPAAGVIVGFNEDWLRYWDPARYRNGMFNIYIIVDPSSGRKAKDKKNDFTTMWVIGLGQDKHYYIIDMIRARLTLSQRCETLFDLVATYEPLHVGYEEYGMQADIEYITLEQERRLFRFKIVPLGGQVPKPQRIAGLTTIFEQTKIIIPRSLTHADAQGHAYDPIATFLDEEYRPYPLVTHDDALDGLARILDPAMAMTWPLPANPDEAQPDEGVYPGAATRQRGLPLHALHQATRNVGRGDVGSRWMGG